MMLDQMFSTDIPSTDPISLKYLSEGLKTHIDQKFDYIKYRQALKGLKEKNIDDQIAIQSTLTTAETMGVNSQDIINSAKQFMELINVEQLKFEKSLINQLKEKVDNKMAENEKNKNEIILNQQRIDELLRQNKNLETDISKNENLMYENKSFIETKKIDFTKTVEAIRNLIQSDITLLNQKIN